MGAHIVVKISKDKDVSLVIEKLKQALSSAGMKNVEFDVQKSGAQKYNVPGLELDRNTLRLM